MATYKYYQPEYVKNFRCDGQKCSAHCCKNNWRIVIDKKTYKKYSHLKPKSAAKEIMRNLKKIDNSEDYQIKLDENFNCPFLTEDNLCYIQKNHGEEFLSKTCATYPRRTLYFEDFYERSLSLTCPLVAEMVLLENEPLKFESIEVDEKTHSNFGLINIYRSELSEGFFDYLISIQKAEIAILQERTLTIDQRLLMLGLYYDKLDELINIHRNYEWEKSNSIYNGTEFGRDKYAQNVLSKERTDELEKAIAIYTNSKFLQTQAAQFSPVIKFNVENYIKIMLGLLEELYGNTFQLNEDRKLLEAVISTLKLQADSNAQVKIGEVAENYTALKAEREKFLQRFSTVFENYLVHEIFFNVYPFRFVNSMNYNFEIFAVIYKMLELLTFSSFMQKENYSEQDLISEIRFYANRIDHNPNYLKKISDFIQGQKDVVEFMQSTLQL